MVVCHRLKCIFLHVPRCAGSSINYYLFQHGCAPEKKQKDYKWPNLHVMYGNLYTVNNNQYELDHATPDIFNKFVDQRYIKEYFKFAFIRNPWDRMLSEYLRKVKHNDNRFIDTRNLSFNDFIKALYKKFDPSKILDFRDHVENSHYIPQYNFVFDNTGTQFLDYIGRFETIDHDMSIINQKLGLEDAKLITGHRTEHDAYCKYYTDEAKNLISEMYARDIEAFHYEFGENDRS